MAADQRLRRVMCNGIGAGSRINHASSIRQDDPGRNTLRIRQADLALQHGFITDRFTKLRNGGITISDTIREWEREQELPKACVFCGSGEDLTTDHLIPHSRGGDDSADNLVQACMPCNTSRGGKGIFEWLRLEKKDELHRLVAGKYLKQLLRVHETAGTLEISKDHLNGLCDTCPLPGVCEEWDLVGRLTCFCLESILPEGL